MLHGLEPSDIDAFNTLVDADHMIRPFRVERVTLEAPQFPLAATLGNRDLAMFTSKEIMFGRFWVSGGTFSHVIDGLDAAPFTRPPGAPDDLLAYEPKFSDSDPYNLVNNMMNEDSWRYIRQFGVPENPNQEATPILFHLRHPETIAQVNIWNNANYGTIKDLDIVFDGDETHAIHTELPDSYDVTRVAIDPPRQAARTISLKIHSWREPKGDRKDVRLVGLDNVQFLRARSPKGVFLDSVGGLVAFPVDSEDPALGGIFLNQINFSFENETAENVAKKRRILSVLLRNMSVGSASQRRVAIPGVNLRYEPVPLVGSANHYMKETGGRIGWFGQKGQDLRDLKVGQRQLADVTYDLIEFTTAPAPDILMLGARNSPAGLPKEITNIQVGRKADVLFFLQAANVTRPIQPHERERIGASNNPFTLPVIARYVLHYADGTTAEIPVVLERCVAHWIQDDPKPLPEARIAWSFASDALGGKEATIYSMKAANPRPDVEIESLDFVLADGADRAVPALLGVTTGKILGDD